MKPKDTDSIPVAISKHKAEATANALRTVAAYIEEAQNEPITIKPDEQDVLADHLADALRAIGVFATVLSHQSVREWILSDEGDETLDADQLRRVFKLLDRSDLTCYEVFDMARSCVDEVLEADAKKTKGKGGRRA